MSMAQIALEKKAIQRQNKKMEILKDLRFAQNPFYALILMENKKFETLMQNSTDYKKVWRN